MEIDLSFLNKANLVYEYCKIYIIKSSRGAWAKHRLKKTFFYCFNTPNQKKKIKFICILKNALNNNIKYHEKYTGYYSQFARNASYS